MTNPNFTDVVLLLDASGSMCINQQATVQALKDYLTEQNDFLGKNPLVRLLISVYEFSSLPGEAHSPIVRTILKGYDLRGQGLSGAMMHANRYAPDQTACTPLMDAIGDLIEMTGARYRGMREEDRPGKVLFVIMTDGYENDSKRRKIQDVKAAIGQQTLQYQWAFVFLGANLDSFAVGSAYGVPIGNIQNWDNTPMGTSKALGGVSRMTSAYSSGAVGASNVASVMPDPIHTSVVTRTGGQT